MTARLGIVCVSGLLLVFACVSYGSALTKCATFDEPNQTVAAWVRLHRADFRLDMEDPPLWEYWAALPNGQDALQIDTSSSGWRDVLETPALQWRFVTHALWNTPPVDGAQVVNRSRAMMTVVGVLLGVLLIAWAWQIAGPVAGVVTGALFAFDPNFLAHASLVKNDVSAALVMITAAYILWRLGRGGSVLWAVALTLICGIALLVKFSSVLLGPVVAALLLFRAFTTTPWRLGSWVLKSRAWRLGLVALVLSACCVVSWGLIWAGYGFRFSATPDPTAHMNTAWVLSHLKGAQVSAAAIDPGSWQPDLMTRASLWALAHHFLPEAWLNGFLFTYATAVLRRGYLLGRLSSTGFWYYFPVAMTLKAPVATLAAFLLAFIVGARRLWSKVSSREQLWTAACVLAPPGIYLASSLRTNMNIGVRHVLPLYAFAEVAAGVVLAGLLRRVGRPAAIALGALAFALVLETASAVPDLIDFFNVVAGGARGGLHELGDSNLDWGQDLPLLSLWQQRHPERPLYLSYFGMVDPEYYGIRYRALPGNYRFGPEPDHEPIQAPAYVAVSASHTQGISVGVNVGDRYAGLTSREPIAVLGGTIYVYDVPDQTTASQLSAQILR